MKNIFKLILLVAFVSLYAKNDHENYDYTIEKKIEKKFNTNKDVVTNITNSYGFINVYLWDENKVSIEVNIKVSGNNQKKILERLDGIDISMDATTSEVIAKTIMGNNYGNNMRIEINYIVKIPKNGAVTLKNNYGNISIEELLGVANITCNYGSIMLGNLNNNTNNIKIAYSKNSTINFVNQLNAVVQYSGLEVQKSNNINLSGNYNKFEINNTGNLNLDSHYSNLKTKNINKLNIDGNYLTLSSLDVKKSLIISSNYSSIGFKLYETLEKVTINANYTNTKILASKNNYFTFEIKLGYGSLKDELGLKYTEKYEKNFNKSYIGYFNSQNKNTINITTTYGSVQFLNQ